MKKTRKISSRIIAILVVLMISLAIVPGVSMASSETKNISGYELLLNRIGISAEYDENAYITRGDFAVLAVQAFKAEPNYGESFFSDISGEQGAYINTAVQLGIVSKNDSRLFYPDRIITLNEATAMCLRLLGYGEILNTPDAYPTKYLAQANKLKLYEGLSSGQEVSGADAAKLIFNTLDSNYIEQVIFKSGAKNEYKLSDSTYLSERFNVKRRTGIITAINETSLNGHSSVEKEYMTIDSRKYVNPYYSGFAYYTYLGRRVDYYTMDSDNETKVIYIRDKSQPEIVNFTDVKKVSGFNSEDSASDRNMPKLTYENEKGNTETLSIKADATILVNGEKKLVITNEDFDLPSGQITLIDRDSDKIYDVVAIEQHTYCRVDYFDSATGKLEVEEGTIFIDIDDFDKEDIVLLAGEREVGTEILIEDAVLQIMCSFKDDGKVDTDKVVVMSLKNQTVEGSIEAIDDEGRFEINGVSYKAMPNLIDELKTRMGQKTIFYLGNDNLIVYYKDFYDKVALIYSYLVDVGTSSGLDSKMYFLIYTEEEEMEEFPVADKIKFTGMYENNYVVGKTIKKEKISSVIQPRQLIRYNINSDGVIDYVELAYDHSVETDYKGFDENRFSLDYSSRSAFLYQRYVGPNYKSNSHTVYFYVDSTSTNEEDFSCYHYIDLGHEVDGAKVKVYDSDTLLQPTIVVIEDYPQSSMREQDNCGSLTIVTNKRYSENKDGSWVTTFDTYQGNTYVVESNDITPLNRAHYNTPTTITNISQIQNGDIIKFGRRKDGEIDRFIMVSEYDETHTESSWHANANDFEAQPHMAEIQYVKGRITSYVPNSHIMVECEENQRFTFSRRSLTYIEYNVEEDKVTYSSSLPRLTVGDYVWFQASEGCEINTLVRYINE